MKIKYRLALSFTLITGIILLAFSLLIYFLAEKNRKESFYKKLENKAYTNAQLLIVVKEVDSTLLNIIDKNTTNELFEEEIIIYNGKKQIIYSRNEFYSFNISNEEFEIIKNEKKLRTKHADKEMVGIFFQAKYNDYYVLALANDKYGKEFIKNLRVILFIVFFSALIIILVISYFYSKNSLLPLNKIIQQIKRIRINDLSIRIDEGNKTDEIAILAINFNKMLDKLQNSFDSQKLFLAGASHELKTPMTSIMGEIEVTLMKARTEEDYKLVLNSILEEIKSLNSLTNSLLELAQTSADFANIAHSNIRIDELIISIQQDLIQKYNEKDVKVNFLKLPEDERYISVSGNSNLLKIAIKNIIDNACKYSENKEVVVNIGFDEKYITIFIKDTGIGISDKDKEKIFTPFFRANNTKNIKGRGIGLPIVKKIIELHDGEITVYSKINEGSEFIVKLPNLIKF